MPISDFLNFDQGNASRRAAGGAASSVPLLVVIARSSVLVVATFVRRAVAASVVTATRFRDDRNDERRADQRGDHFLHDVSFVERLRRWHQRQTRCRHVAETALSGETMTTCLDGSGGAL